MLTPPQAHPLNWHFPCVWCSLWKPCSLRPPFAYQHALLPPGVPRGAWPSCVPGRAALCRAPGAVAACPWVDSALTLWWRTWAARPRAWKQLTADSEGRASHPRISLQLAAASLSHNPLLGLLQSFQQTLSEKKMSCKDKDWLVWMPRGVFHLLRTQQHSCGLGWASPHFLHFSLPLFCSWAGTSLHRAEDMLGFWWWLHCMVGNFNRSLCMVLPNWRC